MRFFDTHPDGPFIRDEFEQLKPLVASMRALGEDVGLLDTPLRCFVGEYRDDGKILEPGISELSWRFFYMPNGHRLLTYASDELEPYVGLPLKIWLDENYWLHVSHNLSANERAQFTSHEPLTLREHAPGSRIETELPCADEATTRAIPSSSLTTTSILGASEIAMLELADFMAHESPDVSEPKPDAKTISFAPEQAKLINYRERFELLRQARNRED